MGTIREPWTFFCFLHEWGLTGVMAIPNMVSGFYGMNVAGLPIPVFWFPLALTAVLIVIVAFVLYKKDMFR